MDEFKILQGDIMTCFRQKDGYKTCMVTREGERVAEWKDVGGYGLCYETCLVNKDNPDLNKGPVTIHCKKPLIGKKKCYANVFTATGKGTCKLEHGMVMCESL